MRANFTRSLERLPVRIIHIRIVALEQMTGGIRAAICPTRRALPFDLTAQPRARHESGFIEPLRKRGCIFCRHAQHRKSPPVLNGLMLAPVVHDRLAPAGAVHAGRELELELPMPGPVGRQRDPARGPAWYLGSPLGAFC